MAKQLMRIFGGLITAAFLLSACAPSTVEQIEVARPVVNGEAPNSTPELLADCFQTATAVAWLDENGDGVWDEGEPPLPGIEFVLEPSVYSRTTTDENGVANIFATTPGEKCPESQRILAVGYEDYQLTTAASADVIDPEVEYAFGFQAEGTDAAVMLSASDLFGVAEEGLAFIAASPVTAVNYLFTWQGEYIPIFEYEQIVADDGRFLHAGRGDVTPQVAQLLASLTRLSPTDEVQYTNQWTDDYPEWYVEIELADGRALLVFAESTGFRGHAPWYILAEGQLYRQTSGDIGYAVYDLVSADAQEYFSLDEGPFDQALLDPSKRDNIYVHLPVHFSGLLPVAPSLRYELDRGAQTLSGTFVTDHARQLEFDTSSRPITAVGQMRAGAPDGLLQPCPLMSAESEFGFLTWTFSCPLPAAETDTLLLSLDFDTADGGVLTSTGRINNLDAASQE